MSNSAWQPRVYFRTVSCMGCRVVVTRQQIQFEVVDAFIRYSACRFLINKERSGHFSSFRGTFSCHKQTTVYVNIKAPVKKLFWTSICKSYALKLFSQPPSKVLKYKCFCKYWCEAAEYIDKHNLIIDLNTLPLSELGPQTWNLCRYHSELLWDLCSLCCALYGSC